MPRASQRKKRPKRRKATIASVADKRRLYEHAVQSPEVEIEFIEDTYKTLRGRLPRSLREDFCGTAKVCCDWVRRRRANTAIGVDIDPEVLDWGRRHNVARLKPALRPRVSLVRGDVRTAKTPRVDVIAAMNFSYWLFDTRAGLRGYFRAVRRHLAPGGVLFLDSYGGSDSYRTMRERRVVPERGPWGRKFTYIWDQEDYDPVSGRMLCHIHFRFTDGSSLRRAFTYHWRLWSLPEIREVLAEAGFSRSTVYWEGTDEKTGEGDGEYAPADRGDSDPAWIVYIVAER
jgi:SAM-dependent methyltransferase